MPQAIRERPKDRQVAVVAKLVGSGEEVETLEYGEEETFGFLAEEEDKIFAGEWDRGLEDGSMQ